MKMKQLEVDNQLFNISYGNFENKRLTVKVHSTIGLYCTPFVCALLRLLCCFGTQIGHIWYPLSVFLRFSL